MVKRVLVIWPLCSKSYGNLLNTRTPFLIPFLERTVLVNLNEDYVLGFFFKACLVMFYLKKIGISCIHVYDYVHVITCSL